MDVVSPLRQNEVFPWKLKKQNKKKSKVKSFWIKLRYLSFFLFSLLNFLVRSFPFSLLSNGQNGERHFREDISTFVERANEFTVKTSRLKRRKKIFKIERRQTRRREEEKKRERERERERERGATQREGERAPRLAPRDVLRERERERERERRVYFVLLFYFSTFAGYGAE